MRTITAHRIGVRREEPLRVGVVLEGVAALVGLVAFIGAVCGLFTWAMVHLIATVL